MKRISVMAGALLAAALWVMPVSAKEDRIGTGIYVNDMNLSGMTVQEARQEIQSYVDSHGEVQIILDAGAVKEGEQIVTTAQELGLKWGNPEILEDACSFGRTGDVLRCYKELKDLEYKNKVYKVAFDFDKSKIRALIEEKSETCNQEAVNASLIKTEDGFQVKPGQSGIVIDVEASVNAVYDWLTQVWDGEDPTLELVTVVEEPQGRTEDLQQVKDLLGTFSTSYTTSGSSRSANVENGCRLINGTVMYPGDEFSAYETVSPFSQDNGYYMAGSYLNGQVVDSLGGGICQVSTTLYNAVLKAELEVTERYNHSMIVTYVEPSADAAIAESSGKDFKFRNNLDYPIYIEGVTTPEKQITFNIYGVETRDPSREVSYESVVLEKMVPDTEVIYTDASQPVGFCSVQSAHIGYKAQLWKIVKENGAEVSREQVNSSTYMKTPRSATVGVATADPAAYEAIMAAVATNSIDQVKAVAAPYKAAMDAAAAQAAAEAAAQAAAQEPAPQPEQQLAPQPEQPVNPEQPQ